MSDTFLGYLLASGAVQRAFQRGGGRTWSGLFGAVRDAPVDVPARMLGRAAGGPSALAGERRSPNNPAIPLRRGCRAGSCRGGVA